MAVLDICVRFRAMVYLAGSDGDPGRSEDGRMTFERAVVKEQNVTFAIVVVKQHVVENRTEANQAIMSFGSMFSGLPVVLMSQDHLGRPKYYARGDIVDFLARIPMQAIPWRKYHLN